MNKNQEQRRREFFRDIDVESFVERYNYRDLTDSMENPEIHELIETLRK